MPKLATGERRHGLERHGGASFGHATRPLIRAVSNISRCCPHRRWELDNIGTFAHCQWVQEIHVERGENLPKAHLRLVLNSTRKMGTPMMAVTTPMGSVALPSWRSVAQPARLMLS